MIARGLRACPVVACAAVAVFAGVGCAGRAPRLALPSSPGQPWPDAPAAWTEATASCRGIRTMSAELALGGRVGVQAIRGRALVGVAPGAIRLEGVAPLGAPAFVLVSAGSDATLLLPRDRAVVREESPAPILDALIGVAMGADDLRVTLTGCVVDVAAPPTGRIFDASTGAVDVADATAFLRKERDGRWRVFAARRDGWQVEYTWGAARTPDRVRLWRDEPRVDVSAVLSQVDLNIELRPDVFHVEVPAGARSMTVDELRAAGPFSGSAAGRS